MSQPVTINGGHSQVIIEGDTFEGHKNAIVIENVPYVRIADCEIRRSAQGAVWLVNVGKVEVVRTKILGAGNPNLHVHDCLTLIEIGDLLIEGCEMAGGDHGCILMRKSRGRTGTRILRGNLFGPCDGSLVTIKEGYNGVLIEGNRFRGAANAASATPGSIIDHNGRINHAAIQLSGDDHRVTNNRVEDCGKGFLLSCSIRRSDPGQQTCNRTLIRGNQFDAIASHAVELQGYSAEMRGSLNDTRIEGNRFGDVRGDDIHQATPGGDWGTVILNNSVGGGSTPPPPPPPIEPPVVLLPQPGTPEHLTLRKDLVRVLNVKRAEAGAPPVAEHPLLAASAQLYCERMSREGFFGHEAPTEPSSIRERIEAAGYRGNLVGEVLSQAFSRDTAEEQIGAWMASPPHRAILLDSRYTEAGFGQFSAFWCGQFGLRPGTTPPPITPPVDPPPVTPPPVTPPTPPVGGGRYRPRAKAVIEKALKGLRYNPLSASRWEMLEDGIATEMEIARKEGENAS